MQDEVDSIFNHLQKFRRYKGNDQAVDISVRDTNSSMHVRRKVNDKLNEEDLMKLSKKELVAMIMAQG